MLRSPWHAWRSSCGPCIRFRKGHAGPNALLRRIARLLVVVLALAFCATPAAFEQGQSPGADATTLRFGAVDYVHRWSKDGQNEFTPRSDDDLATWHDMITLSVHESATNGEQLAEVANRVLANYQGHGKILRTDSRPRTADRPAEHLVVAVLGDPRFLEAAFARFFMADGAGLVAVYSHRVYGKPAGPAMSDWLKANGAEIEKTLMTWNGMPRLGALKKLPQSK